MTAPRADAPGRLAAVAAWQVPLLRRSVLTLTAVAGRLPSWRVRLEGVGRSLDDGESWSGPAARGMAAAVRELSSATWAVDGGLAESLTAFGRLAAEAEAAQELARDALALAAATDGLAHGADDGSPAFAVPAAEAALTHAATASAAAEDAGTALAGQGVRDASPPADFTALAARVPVSQPVCVPPVPVGPPSEVAAWWAALPLAAQLTAIRAAPTAFGARDGLPAWARDQANRLLLAAALRDPGTPSYERFTARAVARRIEAEEAAGGQVQLQLLDLPGDRVVLGLGDLDTADAVAMLVPGIGNTPGDDLAGLIRDARNVAVAAGAAAPGLTVATAVWLGYDSPGSLRRTISRAAAWDGGPPLASYLAGLRAGREAVAGPVPRTTVVAHSYGTVVVDEAADVAGSLAADAVVLLGSPGMEDDARSLEVPEVYDAASPHDRVATLRWFGEATGSGSYGSIGLPVDADAGHSEYYDRDRPTLSAVGEVVAGVRARH